MAINNSLNINTSNPLSPATGGTGVSNSSNTLTINANSVINQDVSTTASPTFVSPRLTSLFDTNAHEILGLLATPAAVNYLQISNNSGTSFPSITALGTATNLAIELISKGDHGINLLTQAVSNAPLLITSGTSSQHITQFAFANTPQARTVTFPDASGTLAFTSNLPSLPLSPANGGTGVNNSTNTLTVNANSTINQDVSTAGSPIFKEVFIQTINDSSQLVMSTYSPTVNYYPFINNNRSRSTVPGSFVTVQTNDILGGYGFYGDDGTQFSEAVGISVIASGTIGTGIVQGTYSISMANSAGNLVPAITVNNDTSVNFASTISTTQINDANGNPELAFTAIASAVNFTLIQNAAAGGSPVFTAVGSDAAVSLTLESKGDSPLILYTSAITQPALVVRSGTVGQHGASIFFPTTYANQNITFPDKSGIVAFTSDIPTPLSTTYINSSPYTVLTTDDVILVDTNLFASSMSVILLASPAVDGQIWTIKDWSGAAAAFNITVTVSGDANTIDGASSFVINQNYESVGFVYSVAEGTYSVIYEANSTGGVNTTITSMTGLNGVLQAPSFVNDSSGNPVLGFTSTPVGINYLSISNNVTGNNPFLLGEGTDTDVGISFSTKGIGTYVFDSLASTNQIVWNMGTAQQSVVNWSVPNVSQNITVITPSASGTIVLDTSSSGSITTAPAASQSSSITLGTAYQNPFGYDVVLTVYLAITAATAGSIAVGVGPTSTPTQQNVVTGLTLAALNIVPITIYLPTGYYALLSLNTVTATISGQQAMPV